MSDRQALFHETDDSPFIPSTRVVPPLATSAATAIAPVALRTLARLGCGTSIAVVRPTAATTNPEITPTLPTR